MRRKSDKQIMKEFIGVLIFGIVAIFAGLFVLTYPLIPATPLEEHKEKEIVISQFDYHGGGRYGASYHYIITEDGERYNITGEYSATQLYDVLSKGTVAVIKYDTNKLLTFKNYAEEMTVDGNKIVTYNNDDPTNWTMHIIIGLLALLIILASLFACISRLCLISQRQKNKDASPIRRVSNPKIICIVQFVVSSLLYVTILLPSTVISSA